MIQAITPLGDRALTVTLGNEISDAMYRRVRTVMARLDETGLPGVIECVPAFASVTVHYDPTQLLTADQSAFDALARSLNPTLTGIDEARIPAGPLVDIPVSYGHDLGPDLDDVAHRHGISPDEVVRRHTAGEYFVSMVGFVPGFGYLGGLDPALAT